MSKTELKKHLLSLTKEQVIEQVLGLYDTCKQAKEYFEYFLNPDEKEQFEKYKAIIVNEFYPKGKYVEAKTRFSVAKKAIADFRSLNPSPELLGYLMVTLAEQSCKYTFDFGDMWEQYYTSAATNFELALKFLQKHGLLEQFKLRCQDCVKYAEPCGYGFADEIGELFDEFY
ncbi:MAG: DUF6155 family protein [Bacteroidota bacterium]|nr:DUF6155 family protein [Bacteroidota bacterium]